MATFQFRGRNHYSEQDFVVHVRADDEAQAYAKAEAELNRDEELLTPAPAVEEKATDL